MMNRYLPSEDENIRVLGRTTACRDPLTLFWTASGVELMTDGAELAVEMTAGFDTAEPWIEIQIDGTLSQRRMLERGPQRIGVFRGMTKGQPRHVRILRATQAANADPESFLQLNAVLTDGALLPLDPPRLRLEIIGDSLTSGEGLGGARRENAWNGCVFGVTGSYHDLLSRELNAETHIVSESGYGVYCSWCGMPAESIPPYYDRICGTVSGALNESLGAQEVWDFGAWKPDAVIVNLGTNDAGSFAQAGNEFPDRNWRCPMRVNADGSPFEEDRLLVYRAAADFLRALRAHNPGSYILWCYGMIPGVMEATLRDAVADYARESKDERVEFMLLPPCGEDELGSRNHPGYPSHRKTADALKDRLTEILKL
ncbi:MAG: GDSL family lipase [Clostridia bacterium]|nr:GDSL family lipase [Clostridia bacterium]